MKDHGIDDELIFYSGDWLVEKDLEVYLVLTRFGTRTDSRKTYKLIIKNQVIEFQTKVIHTFMNRKDYAYENGLMEKGLLVKNIPEMKLPKEFEGIIQDIVWLLEDALSAASPRYDTIIHKVDLKFI